MTPSGKPAAEEPTAENKKVLLADTEINFWQKGSQGFGVRLNEVDAHPTTDSQDVVLRFVFAKKPTIIIDKDSATPFALSSTVVRMANGLRVKYNGVFLDVCGTATRDLIMAVDTPNGSFRLAVKPQCVEINETYFLGDFGLACYPKWEGMISAPHHCTVSAIGEPEDELRVRYKTHRYVIDFVNGALRISPYIKRSG